MNILVTGSSRGIGKAVAEYFLAKGHVGYGMDVNPTGIQHVNYTHFQSDITKELPELPEMDILINNAGVQQENDIDVNLKGTIRVTEKYAFHKGIRSVIFMASASARNGAEFPEYVASKGGILAYMKNVALRLAAYGGTANSISAGGVNTPLNAHIMNDPDKWEAVLNETLLHKWAEPEEIAAFTYFLSVENKSMTGEDLLIDNGEMLKSNFIW